MQGLAEGTETIAIFIAFCLWPQWFSLLAYGFAFVCAITIVTRISGGFHTLDRLEQIDRNTKAENNTSVENVRSEQLNVNSTHSDIKNNEMKSHGQ